LISFRNIFKPNTSKNTLLKTSISQIIGFPPKKLYYYIKAFTHGSTNQRDSFGNSISYERLEFVGDAILSAVIAHYLFEKVLEGDEGYLTKMRSKIVSRDHLNQIGKELSLSTFLRTKIPVTQFGDNIHGNLLEALIGAVFLDKGYAACEQFIYKTVITPHVDLNHLEGKIISYKGLIIEWCQKEKKQFNFENQKDAGQDLIKHFSIKLLIDGKPIAKARATSKKKAEEKVSKRAYFALQTKIDKTF
jgi:ribonuclease-3